MKAAEIKMKLPLKSFIRDLIRISKESAEVQNGILRKAVGIFASAAQKYTPPNMGGPMKSRTPSGKPLYKRPVYELLPILIDHRRKSKTGMSRFFAPEDPARYKSGYKYKVPDMRKKRWVWHYYKTKGAANKAAVILNRGLYRAMWGANAAALNMQPANAISALIRKSPLLASHAGRFNPMSEELKEGSAMPDLQSIRIANTAIPESASFANIAAVRGLSSTIYWIRKAIQAHFKSKLDKQKVK